MDHQIRKADIRDLESLNALAYRSEALWGYDPEHMDHFRTTYRIKETDLRDKQIFILGAANAVEGFYGLIKKGSDIELEYMYVDRHLIGKGIGRKLWDHMIMVCQEQKVHLVEIVCSKVVKSFYLKMGAQETGEMESFIDQGVMISKLEYRLTP